MSKYKSQKLTKVAKTKGLYRNGHGVYVAKLRINGNPKTVILETSDLAVAERLKLKLIEESKYLGDSTAQNALFEDIAQTWLEGIKGASEKIASWKRRDVAVNGLKPYFTGYKIKEIGFNEIEQWQLRRGNIVSVRSHNIELETLNLIFRYAIKKGCVLRNPAADFKRRKQTEKAVNVDDIPTKEQFNHIVRFLRESPFFNKPGGAADMVEFYAYSGTRLKEGAEVLVRDILKDGVRITGGPIKTKNYKTRIVPMFEGLGKLLKRMLEEKENKNPNSKLFTIQSPTVSLGIAAKSYGYKKFTTHSLRHFFVTNALEQNINPKLIADWIGHSDSGMLLLSRYGHLRKDFSDASAKLMTFQATY